jgi:hypothetical protein
MNVPAPLLPNTAGGGCIRGAAFCEFIRWYERQLGASGFAARLTEMPDWMRQDLDLARPALGIAADIWYPDVTVHRLLDLLLAGLTPGQRHALALQGATHAMEVALGGVFGMMFAWIATPALCAQYGNRLWRSYFDSGELSIESSEDGLGAVSTVRNWATHHPFLCELHRGSALALYRAMKCKDVSSQRVACVSDGGSECSFVTRFRF